MNIKRFLLFFLIGFYGLAHACAADGGGKKPPVERSPERVKKEVLQTGASPLKRVKMHQKYLQEKYGPRMTNGRLPAIVLEHVDCITDTLDEARSTPSPRPSYPQEIATAAAETQQLVVGKHVSLADYGKKSFFEKYRTKIYSAPAKHTRFRRLATFSGRGYISTHHILDGDPGSGGQHFIRDAAVYAAFCAETVTQRGHIIRNTATGVEYGVGLRAGSSRSVVNCHCLSSDDVITRMILDMRGQTIPSIGQTKSTLFTVIPAGRPLEHIAVELCHVDTDVVTCYPIFAFSVWKPASDLDVVTFDLIDAHARVIQRTPIVMTARGALAFARIIIRRSVGCKGYSPVRYVTDHGTLILDFAPTLQAAGAIDVARGIYVEFPVDVFDLSP